MCQNDFYGHAFFFISRSVDRKFKNIYLCIFTTCYTMNSGQIMFNKIYTWSKARVIPSHAHACRACVSCLNLAERGIQGHRTVRRGWVAPSVWTVYVCARVTVCVCACINVCGCGWGSALTTLCCLHYISMPDRDGEKRVRGRVRDTARESEREREPLKVLNRDVTRLFSFH